MSLPDQGEIFSILMNASRSLVKRPKILSIPILSLVDLPNQNVKYRVGQDTYYSPLEDKGVEVTSRSLSRRNMDSQLLFQLRRSRMRGEERFPKA